MDQAHALRTMLDRTAPPEPLRVIAVTSGKGGVGKTHLAANLAVLAARAGRRVLLVDADLGLANADIVLGLRPTHHIGHLLDGTAGVEDVLARGPAGVRVLGASSGVQSLTNLTPDQRLALVAALEPFEHAFDLVLVDCAAGIGDNVIFFAGAADEALLVVTPEPTSLADAYATVKVLTTEAGVRRFSVVANLAADFQGRDVFRRLTQVTDQFLDAKLTYLGNVPRDEDLPRALRAQRPVVDLHPRSASSRAFATLCRSLLASRPPPSPAGNVTLFWRQLLEARPGAA